MLQNDLSLFRKDRVGKPGGGICALIAKTTFNVVPVEISPEFSTVELICFDVLLYCQLLIM